MPNDSQNQAQNTQSGKSQAQQPQSPVGQDVSESSSAESQDSSTGKKYKVMIVEDDPILLRMYTEKLNFEGYEVVAAKNGEDALTVASSESPDLIILDIMLPRMSGTDFLERYRETSGGKNTPVLALTNLAEEEERQRATELGVKEYLVKAMQTPEQVLGKVKKYLG